MFETSEKFVLRGSDIVALLASAAVFVSVFAQSVGAMITVTPQAHAAVYAAPVGHSAIVANAW